MQLFVMPVTSKLLSSKNRALEFEFPFAVEKHIPVLPLMQEKGLETLFNQKCGNIQFLDKYSGDVTALKYEEKLKTYLNTVLIGDELAEKIRAAFDAYVFLSYRKKDRKYAQELMRLVHKNDFCRDIAIWYDEFLTPGEDFNNSIKEALQKSDLFWAICKCAEILAESSHFFKAIEKYHSAFALLKAAEQFSDSPVVLRNLSKYYIGLGRVYIVQESDRWIQDEENFLRAKWLFEQAKQSLYKIKVPFDKLISEMNCDLAEVNISMGKVYLHMTWNDEIPYRYTEEAEYCYQDALNSYSMQADYLGSEQYKRALSLCYEGLAEVYHTRFDFVQARKFYEKTIQLRTELAEETRADADRINLEFTHTLIEKMCQDEASVAEARVSRKQIDTPYLTRTATKETIALSGVFFIIGKEKRVVNYQVSDNPSVSRSHAEIRIRSNEYYIADLFSRNGTFVNGKRIPTHQDVRLHDGDTIRLGTEPFIFHA